MVFAMAMAGTALLAASSGDIASRWTIGAGPAETGERTARVGEVLWKQPLRSDGFVTLTTPAMTVKGKQLLPAGAEMVAMGAGDRVVFCEAAPRKASGGEMFLIGSIGETASCLADADKDGRFDGYFTKKVQYVGFPVIRGGLPDTAKALQPLTFEVRPAGETVGGYWVGVRYVAGGKAPRFQIVFGGRDDEAGLSGSAGNAAPLPRTVEVLGAQFTVLSVDGGVMRYRIDRPMPEQPFSVVRSVIFS